MSSKRKGLLAESPVPVEFVDGKPSVEYRAWASMLDRCYNEKCTGYANYGGRGVSVCDEWRSSYEAFLAYLGRRPSPTHSIDRINVNGNYEPGNVRWATKTEQSRNRRGRTLVTIEGKTKCVAEWLELNSIAYVTFKKRRKAGWDIIKAVTETPHTDRKGAAERSWITRKRNLMEVTINE